MWRLRRRAPRLREEIRFHREQLIDDYLAAGLNRAEAERRAFLEFGNPAQIEEACHDVRGRLLSDLLQDLRYALRALRRTPGFTAVAVLSLALGLGANAAIFSIVDAVMLQSLPVHDPDRLVQIARLGPDGRPGVLSYPLFEYFRDQTRSLSGTFMHAASRQAIVIGGEEDLVRADLVSGAYFDVLGIAASAGRLLRPADDGPAPEVAAAVITDGYWLRRFGRNPAAIGSTFTLRDRPFTIVGVLPASYRSVRVGHAADIVLPLALTTSETQRREVTNNWLSVIGRLKQGATLEQADAEVQVLWSAFLRERAARAPEKARAGILSERAAALPAAEGINHVRAAVGRPLLVLMGIAGLILTLACVNLAGLLVARGAARRREISIRLTIGAGRGRLVRQLVTESLVLALLGGTIGIAAAPWLSGALVAPFVAGRDLELAVQPSWRAAAFTAAAALAACVLAGVTPALHATRTSVNPTLKEVKGAGRTWLGPALVVAQLALSMMLIVGATLFVATLIKLYTVDRGFDSSGVLVVTVRNARPYAEAQIPIVQRGLLERIAALPGVQSASAAQVLPIGGGLWSRDIEVDGYTFRPDESASVAFNAVAPAYFATLATPILSGREFDDRDIATAPKVAVVNESFARDFFAGRPALGRRVTSLGVSYEIVGIVRDAKYQSLRADTIRTMYIPWMQREGDQPSRYSYLARAVGGDPMRLTPAMERLVREADPGLRLQAAVTYAALVDRSIATERIMATLGAVFGVLALVLAGLGVFGVLAFQVARRTNEIGVRMALGATPRSMLRLVLRDVAALLLPGLGLGAGAAWLLAGLTERLLFGMTPTEPAMFAIAALVLSAGAVLAGWLPARRASRVDPLIALRHE